MTYRLTADPKTIQYVDGAGREWTFDLGTGHRFEDEYEAWLAEGNTAEPYQVGESLDALKERLTNAIDVKVADIYSNWMRFAQEYLERQAAAQAFKDAGYVGDPGPWVTAFAVPAGKTNQEATDIILAQSVMLNGALATLGALRMRKYEVIGAADPAAAQASYDDIMAKIDQTAAQIH
ncbi:hypothetical protein [Caballeronia zhejiangensis]|uniref:Uncharacterized protein n=1 Tax=Caballeronia zhejiangensis TaxID=871203 RepID=A0A656QFC2_9BURK|nr:hypothetical protein [Caballeronia zhejiangensis]KDR25962.1 hypothetical protein BG60_26485 [Caballeronia zhejiangensis]